MGNVEPEPDNQLQKCALGLPFRIVFLKIVPRDALIVIFEHTRLGLFPTLGSIIIILQNLGGRIQLAETLFGLPVDGIVGPLLWDTLADIESDIRSGEYRNPGQFSGNPLSAS
jgi:hypothetical protein